ncbi:TetR family transcriptional regulator [Shimia litoralis]|uniref:TetR family transcriptional regulator n=1 Tax=Shimia litoralis TaxID=420403 RepID=A0A4U7N783_9RHOB|nr:TetR/AcrR family transcriptional regulator [Shimia litoralis]TKZ21762.1 TetR family transcriptional regulator [Shimia litoralis]
MQHHVQDTQKANAPRRGRPKKAGTERLETRERLVRCGIEFLTEQGYAQTGINDVLRKVGVPKGSFYHYFSSKDDFCRAVIDGYALYFAKKLDRWLLVETRAPLDRLRDFVEDGKRGLERFSYRRGCLIGNLGQELGATQDQFRTPLEAVFQDWQRRVQTCLQLAQDAGDISPDADCARLAAFFWIGWEGAILRAKLVQSSEPVDLFAETFFNTLPR